MRLNLLPSEVAGILLTFASQSIVRHVLAGPAVNVALQASFNASPYILELLSVVHP